MRSLFSIVAVSMIFLLSVATVSQPVFAHPTKPVVNDFKRADIQALRKFLGGDTSGPDISAFKAPAEGIMVTICRMQGGKLNCYPELTNLKCPDSILVETPDGRGEFVDVNCTGPDANGQCECDFAQ